jgi:formamidopyrimidine-DNA glycosylase
MPELPEVEIIKCHLKKHIKGRTIKSFYQQRLNIRYQLNKDLKYLTEGARIINIWRRAKYLILDLDREYGIIVHLGMSGKFLLVSDKYLLQKHDHIQFILDNNQQLIFNDPRRFGMVYCVPTAALFDDSFFKNFGPEPLTEDFNPEYLLNCLKGKKSPIKNVIMDNKIVVGVGNIYASESLFLSKINPEKMSNSLNLQEIKRLVMAIKEILTKAIASGGTTLKDFVNADNKPGYFKQKLLCYDRKDLSCFNCYFPIIKIKQAGRATYFCPKCQSYD